MDKNHFQSCGNKGLVSNLLLMFSVNLVYLFLGFLKKR